MIKDSNTSFNVQEIEKSHTEELLRKIIDERMAEDRFISRRELHNILDELNQKQEEPISSAAVTDLLKEVDFKEGLIPKERTREYLLHRGRKYHNENESLGELRKRLSINANGNCEEEPSADELDGIARAVMEGEPSNRGDRRMSTYTPKRVNWFWKGRIPLGKLTLLDGDPGFAKSTITLDLAARASTGRSLPDGTVEPLNCRTLEPLNTMVMTTEDDAEDTVVPRLIAAGADMDRIYDYSYRDAERTKQYYLPDDVKEIEEIVRHNNINLIIIDPLYTYLSSKVNPNSDQQVKQALAPLAAMAQRTNVAIIAIRHLKKGETDKAIYKGGGSIGVIGSARAALAVGKHPNNEDQYVLAVTKTNLSKQAPSLAYSLVEEEVDVEDGTTVVTRIEWGEEVGVNADDLLSSPLDKNPNEIEKAKAFLEMALIGPRPSAELAKEAERQGTSESTLKKAKRLLDCPVVKENNRWVTYPPKGSTVQEFNSSRVQPSLAVAG